MNLTFAFRDTAPTYNHALHNEQGTFTHVNPAEIDAAILALALWSDVSGLSFTRVGSGYTVAGAFSDHATMLFGNYQSSTDGAGAFALQPRKFNSPDGTDDNYGTGDVWINTNSSQNLSPQQGSYAFQTFLHEIGHALGLNHPGNYNAGPGVLITYAANAEYIEDTKQYTVMSYFDASYTGANHVYGGNVIYGVTPLLHDIKAVQRLYGYNATTRTDDTVYGFHSNADRSAFHFISATDQKVFAIWDAGGNDTFDASGYSNNQVINLEPGAFSSIGALIKNIAMAAAPVGAPSGFDYFIENAFGGSGNDTIVGNLRDNRLEGRGGADSITSGNGDDTLEGGAGIDTLEGGAGSDKYYVNAGQDVIKEAAGAPGDTDWILASVSYVLASGQDIEGLVASDPFGTTAMDLTGNDIANRIYGNDGNNTIDGKAEADLLFGYGGNDIYIVDNAGDKATEATGDGNDTVVASVSYRLKSGSEIETLRTKNAAGTGAMDLTGNEFPNAISGNAGINELAGAGGNDVVRGFGGSDTLAGGGGADTLEGFRGNDTLDGSAGKDTAVYTAAPINFYSEGDPNYCIRHNADGSITIEHEHGAGTDGIDTLKGIEFGNFGGTIIDLSEVSVECGSSAGDYINGWYNVDDNLHGGVGDDIMQGDVLLRQNDTVGPGNDRLMGDDGNDNLQDGFGGDFIYGGKNDDYILGGVDNSWDLLDGGVGNDTIIVNGFTGVSHDVVVGGAGDDAIATFSTFGYVANGGAGNDALYGYWYGSSITSLSSGSDTLYGGDGDDLLVGATGADSLDGGDGNDVINISVLNAGGTDGDILDGGDGDDQLYSYDYHAPDHLFGGRGTADFAYIDRTSSTTSFTLDLTKPAIEHALPDGTIVQGVESMEFFAGSGNDSLTGGALEDQLYGGLGNDTLDGGPGADLLAGGFDDDWYYVDDPNDMVSDDSGGQANAGNDRVFASVSYKLDGAGEIETLSTDNRSGTDPIGLTGNDYAQRVIGNAGDNVIDGRTGDDTLTGLGGNDTYYVWTAGTVVNEDAGEGTDHVIVYVGYLDGHSYTLRAGSEIEAVSFADNYYAADLTGNEFDNTILGNDSENTLSGRDGNDTIEAGWGNDTLVGGAGADSLTGSYGGDIFDLNTVGESSNGTGRDTISDFTSFEGDKIDLTDIDAKTGVTGNQAFTFLGSSPFAHHAGELRFDATGGDGFLFGDVDGDGKADLQVLVSSVISLSLGDLLL